jgi:hypothetical protein
VECHHFKKIIIDLDSIEGGTFVSVLCYFILIQSDLFFMAKPLRYKINWRNLKFLQHDVLLVIEKCQISPVNFQLSDFEIHHKFEVFDSVMTCCE